MSLNSLFNIGRSALSSQQRRIQVIQNNVANASTPGYRRQRINLVTLGGNVHAADVHGVTPGSHQSITATYIDRQITYNSNAYGYHSARAELGQIAEGVLDPFDGVDLTQEVSAFFDSLRALEVSPGGEAERASVVARANELASTFSRVRNGLDETRREAAISAGDLVDDLNQRLDEIAILDDEIAASRGLGDEPYDLIDRRDQIAAELAVEIGVRSVPTKDGRIHLATPEGAALIEGGRARRLTLVQTTAGELEIQVLDGKAAPRSLNQLGGQLGGLVSGHNDLLGDAIEGVDQLAYDFVNEFNAQHQAGMGLDGVSGRDFFTAVATVDGAARMVEVDAALAGDHSFIAAAADATEIPGGNTNLLALIGIESQALSTGVDAQGAIRDITQALGEVIKTDALEAESAEVVMQQLEAHQASISGVSLEEEMIALTEAQRGLEASLKIIQASDEMLQDILSLKS